MNEEIKIFLEQLKSRSDVLGVIMFGSWARGNNRPDSDVDMVVILIEGYRRTVEYVNKQAFEIIYTTEKSAIDFWKNEKDDCFGLWSVARVLYDKDETIERLKAEADKIIKDGKNPIDDYQREQYKFSAQDELFAVRSILETDPATANLIISRSVLSLGELFFDLRQMWTPAPKQILTKLKEVSPEISNLFERFYTTPNIENKISIVDQIIPIIFKE